MDNLGSAMSELIPLVEGLWVVSETDAPLKPFIWPEPLSFSPEQVLALKGESSETPVETRTLEEFFKPMFTLQDWFGEQEIAQAKQFESLYTWLEKNLTDSQVYRIGEIQITVFIVGQLLDRTIGLTTLLVET